MRTAQQEALADSIRDDPRWREFLERTRTTPEELAAIDFEVPLPQ